MHYTYNWYYHSRFGRRLYFPGQVRLLQYSPRSVRYDIIQENVTMYAAAVASLHA